MFKTMHHIGVAVRDVDAARRFYVEKLGMKIVFDEPAPNGDVWVVGLAPPSGGCLVELLGVVKEPNPLTAFMDKYGETTHHVAYEVENVDVAIAQCKTLGFQMLDEKPRPGAHKSRIAFIHPKSTGGLLSELVEPAKH
jgi:methylmalonyl-CoA/ethylmalonyl-CoA epimerase